jgi:hypothetical protein
MFDVPFRMPRRFNSADKSVSYIHAFTETVHQIDEQMRERISLAHHLRDRMTVAVSATSPRAVTTPPHRSSELLMKSSIAEEDEESCI